MGDSRASRALFRGYKLSGPPSFVIRNRFAPNLRFEGRRTDQAPPDGTLAYMYRHNGDETFDRCGAGEYRDGKWTNGKGRDLNADNLFWTVAVDDRS